MNESESSPPGPPFVFSYRWTTDFVICRAVGFLFVCSAYRIRGSFVSLIAWGGVIAIAVYPLFLRFGERLGGRPKLAMALLVLIGLALIVPSLKIKSWSDRRSRYRVETERRGAEWEVTGLSATDWCWAPLSSL